MRYARNVATVSVNDERCTGCGMCLEVCPRAVLQIREDTVRVVDRDACIECGACAKNCACKAISVDAGVGCAAAMINGLIRFGNPDKGSCDCSGSANGSNCC